MRKFLLTLLVILGSKWFAPVIFVTSTIAAMKLVCHQNNCERAIPQGDLLPPMFKVMVRLPTKGNQIKPVLLTDLKDFIDNNPDLTLQLPAEEGVTNDGSWEYSAREEKQGFQIIEAHSIEGARIDVRYRASHQSVQPLRLKVVSQGILFISMPLAGAFTWLFVMFIRRTQKKARHAE
ncbi:hypothetical protein [Massilia scottii]|uniref:hypothetical protein n=1 Tax=Massilia scottii TaxID=3057166 RepID=UPI002796A7A6|nr:hypothetical protein [Massilia sp. CCM 9029]MDQ1832763.1 hypothetical protein [Massilia sp. CCM 9029]